MCASTNTLSSSPESSFSPTRTRSNSDTGNEAHRKEGALSGAPPLLLAKGVNRCANYFSKILDRWNSVLPNRGNSMFLTLTILEFCRGLNDNAVVQTSHPVQQCRTFQCTIPQEIGGRSSMRQIRLQFLLPRRMCLRRAPSSRRTGTPTPHKHPGLFRQPLALEIMTQSGQNDS